ncbi:solute carrier family 35 member F5 [Plodia interpunctella]|uniref:solute carrier family 35 member F5 n=1 Tax=Plodia interpunctella TaxID=58824 RepID=UPI002368F0D8|nr:solute carrier family 35 member F5 [Plodia interpunctella]
MLTLCHDYFRVSALNKNSKDGPQFSRRKYFFGIFLLLLVVILWVLSSELTKYIYVEKTLDRPFLVTYIRSSLLFVYLLVLCFTPPTSDPCRPADYTQLLEPTTETDDENYFTESGNSLGDSTFVPVRAGETTDSDDAAPRAVRFNKVAEVRVMSAAMAGEALLARLSWQASVRASEYAQRRAAAAATRRHLRMAVIFSIPWFIANYLYRLSLKHSNAASTATYTSSSSAVALTLGAVFAQSPADRMTLSKRVSVFLTAMSLLFLGVADDQHNWKAISSALGAAICYAVHLLLLRQELKKGNGINYPLLVGLVGCACGCLAWVLGGILGAVGIEAAEVPPPKVWSWLLLDAAVGPLLMESLWLWGRSLTSRGTATGVLGAIPPLSACVELYRGAGAGADADAGAGGAWRGAGAALAGVAWLCAALDLPGCRRLGSGSIQAIRNIPDLEEQSEALICPDEPT